MVLSYTMQVIKLTKELGDCVKAVTELDLYGWMKAARGAIRLYTLDFDYIEKIQLCAITACSRIFLWKGAYQTCQERYQ